MFCKVLDAFCSGLVGRFGAFYLETLGIETLCVGHTVAVGWVLRSCLVVGPCLVGCMLVDTLLLS